MDLPPLQRLVFLNTTNIKKENGSYRVGFIFVLFIVRSMHPSVTVDTSLKVCGYNKAFVGNIMPEKMTLGYKILLLFDKPDRLGVQNAFQMCRSEPGPFATVYGKKITTIASEPTAFPIRSEYDCIISYAEGVFYVSLVLTRAYDSDREAGELRDFFNKAPIALHWLSDDGKVLWANERELEVLEYSRSEYIGEDIMKFCPDSKEKVLDIFKELGSGNTIRDVPVRFRTKTGKIKDLLIDSNVNYKDDGSFNHTRCFIRDDTGRKIREARAEVLLTEAQRLAKEKGRFVAKLLHEIKTPLHIMSMAISVGEKRSGERGEKDDLVQSQTAHLSRLVSNMSTAMRFDDGNTPPEDLVECNMLQYFENYSKPSFPAKFCAVDMVLTMNDSGAKLVMIDTGKLTIVLDELLMFCGQVSVDGGRLKVRVTNPVQSSEYLIEVSCVCPELSEAFVQKVFHSYWLDSASSNQPLHADTPGLNLGLNIAFNNVQCLGSDLAMESTAEKTCFSFTLKLPPATDRTHETTDLPPVESEANTAEKTEGIGLNDSPSRHVLLAEDNTVCQKICKRLLEKLGHMCHVADNGAIAVDMVTGPDCVIYDVVFMDIRMPIMDGIEATTKITQHLAQIKSKVPIIALTAEDNFDISRPEYNVGFCAVLKKPASVADFERVLAEFSVSNLLAN